jgi:hypothetical protein
VLDPFPLGVENSATKLLVKHHADKRHQHNQPVATAAEIQMVVKDTGIAHDIGRICGSHVVERPFIYP